MHSVMITCSPILKDLYWLPGGYQAQIKRSVLTIKALNSFGFDIFCLPIIVIISEFICVVSSPALTCPSQLNSGEVANERTEGEAKGGGGWV